MKVNAFSTTTSALFAALGVAFQQNLIPTRYAGYALIAATLLQAFQPKVATSDTTITAVQLAEAPAAHQEVVAAVANK